MVTDVHPRAPGVTFEAVPEVGGRSPIDVAEAFRDLPGLAILESARPGRRARWSYLCADPIEVIDEPTAAGEHPLAGARRSLERLLVGRPASARLAGDRLAGDRLGGGPRGGRRPRDSNDSTDLGAGVDPETGNTRDWRPPFLGGLVGYLGYDLARHLERLPDVALDDQRLPLLRLGLYRWVVAWDRRTGAAWLGGRAVDGDTADLERVLHDVRRRLRDLPAASKPPGGAGQLTFRSNLDRSAYLSAVESIRRAIADGQIYQANLARRLETEFSGDPWHLYRLLRTGDPALHAAYVDLGRGPAGGGRLAILSASPEPFLAVDPGGRVFSDPIKGTRPRGSDRTSDRALACELLVSAKDRAENIMIVDVLRNDLGRVCRPGTVRVPRLCRLERSATVQHLVSTVTGGLRPDRDPFDLLAAAFPGGSVTGAPKIRAMEILETLEPVRRGPYTGALGWIGPDGVMATSILIRTLVADGRRLTLHVGGGITWRSDPRAEWAETQAKARGPLAAIGAVEIEG